MRERVNGDQPPHGVYTTLDALFKIPILVYFSFLFVIFTALKFKLLIL